jgi:hypothetical protein
MTARLDPHLKKLRAVYRKWSRVSYLLSERLSDAPDPAEELQLKGLQQRLNEIQRLICKWDINSLLETGEF